MTIVEVVLHKWQMLSDRRRKVIIGSILIAVILMAVIVFAGSSKSEGGHNQPVTTPAPPTTTPEPARKPVASKDGFALVSMEAELATEPTVFFQLDPIETVDWNLISQVGQTKEFNVTLNSHAQDAQLVFKFNATLLATNCELVEVRWTNADGQRSCLLDKNDANFVDVFHWTAGKHRKCSKQRKFKCLDDEGKEVASLAIDNFEIELDRKVRDNLDFETPAMECG